ncbi:hypothetical protein AB0C21_12035 [Spirillospora sp. NPDC049024]
MNTALTAESGLIATTMGEWRHRFAVRSFAESADGERSGRPQIALVLSGPERAQSIPAGASLPRCRIPAMCGNGRSHRIAEIFRRRPGSVEV